MTDDDRDTLPPSYNGASVDPDSEMRSAIAELNDSLGELFVLLGEAHAVLYKAGSASVRFCKAYKRTKGNQ